MILENKLEYLADSLVPENIKTASPQFSELIKSFLRNVEDVQSSINSNFLDTIDYDKIKTNEIKQIYLNTYLGQMNFKDVDNIESLGDLIKVSKDLSVRKGTAVLYQLLLNLLYYIMPEIGNTYNNYLKEFNDPNTTLERKKELEQLIQEIKTKGNPAGEIIIEEIVENGEIVPFIYNVKGDIDEELFYKYLKKFAHPSGWGVNFDRVFVNEVIDLIKSKATMTLYDTFEYPLADGLGVVDSLNTNLAYPNNYYIRAELGLEADYDSIVSKLTNTDNIIVETGKVYYVWDNLNNPKTVSGSFDNEGDSGVISTPSITGIKPTGGSYTTTEDIAYGDGVITGGTWRLTYKTLVNK